MIEFYQIMKKITLFIIKTSRPKFWIYLAGPFLMGFAFIFNQNLNLLNLFQINPIYFNILIQNFFTNFYLKQFIVGLLFFLLPANFFLYAINDYYDFDTDAFNPKKGTHEVKLKNKQQSKKFLIFAIIISFLYFIFLPNHFTKIIFLLFMVLSYIYSAKPIRLKAKPFVDSASNLLYFLPGVISYNIATNQLIPWFLWVAFFCWTFSMHLFSAVPDISADKKANLLTTAIFLGYKKSLLLCALMWLIFSTTLIYNFGWILLPTILYFLMPIYLTLNSNADINKIYWRFPYINAILGFFGFILIVFKNNL